MRSYIPQREADMKAWAINFAALITAAPATYGLTAPNAVTIQTAVDNFSAAMVLATDPGTRTEAKIADKDAKKAVMLATVRPFAQQVRNNVGVTNLNKIALGLTVVDRTPTPVPAPVTQPLLSIIAATPLNHTLRFADSATPDKRAKPEGAAFIQLFVHVGDAPPADYTDWRFVGAGTKNPVSIDFVVGDVGKVARYAGRWCTRTGKPGPWSGVSQMVVVG